MFSYGAKMPRVNWATQLASINLPLPPTKEQKKIANYLKERNSGISNLKTNLKTQISTLEQYRKSLIHECVTGKRRITKKDLKEVQPNV